MLSGIYLSISCFDIRNNKINLKQSEKIVGKRLFQILNIISNNRRDIGSLFQHGEGHVPIFNLLRIKNGC